MKKILHIIAIAAIAFLAYVVISAIVPYVKQPQISKEAKKEFNVEDFYGDALSGERAMVISDNNVALEERLRLIVNAKERIILSTFEFHSDESGKDMLSALIDAADRGVKVSILVDGFPATISLYGNSYFLALAESPNAEIRIYNPVNILKTYNIMGRLHDKYLITDNSAYILGGRNTYDYFLGEGTGYQNYDWDVLVYNESGKEEKSMLELVKYFENIWGSEDCKVFGENSATKSKAVDNARKELKERCLDIKNGNPELFEEYDYIKVTKPVNKIKLLSNPITTKAKEPTVFYGMIQLMKNAQNSVVFHTPYIICNDWMLSELKDVCDNVESVTMMTNSVANNGNPFGAMDYDVNKDKILDTGVKVQEYDGGVSYHGKCFTIDERLSAIGSFNWDMRSTYLDTELMLVIDSEEINSDLKEKMNNYSKESLEVVDINNSIPPEGVEAQKVSIGQAIIMKIIRLFEWARFLM